jgi:drug/metabolite transporter (DMT)-like permease
VTLRKHLVLAGVVLFSSFGNVFLSQGMKQVGEISVHNFHNLFSAILNPWVAGGIVLLTLFFVSYLSALSWADLTYVLPATATGYILMALLAHYFLHEHVSVIRWFGIVLITAGVGFVAGGPVITVHEPLPELEEVEQ